MQEGKPLVLVTGAGGFLGKRLTQILLDQGARVRAMVHSATKLESFEKHPDLEVVVGDIVEPESMRRITQGCKQVYHLAAVASDWASDSRVFYKVNFKGALNVLEAAHANGVQRCVVTSTMGVIGPPDPKSVHPVDEDHIRWVNFFTEYASSKILAEERIQHMVREGADIVIVNPTRIFGPGAYDRKNGLVILIDHYLHRPFAIVPGNRSVIGNYVYIDDVCQGHILAMEKGKAGEKYILGGYDLNFSQILGQVKTLTQRNGRILRIPFGVIGVLAAFGWVKAKVFKKQPMATFSYIRKIRYNWPVSIAKAQRELNYQPRTLDQALEATISWVKERRSKA